MNGVQFPEMRASVLSAVAALADHEYQQRIWLEHRYPHENFYDDLDERIHALYDDCAVLPDPRRAISTILIDNEELGALVELDRVLSLLIDDLGVAPDSVYVGDARWGDVMKAAREALVAMTRNP
ncbi:SCO4402 family protein [Nocardia sp. IBHARD005]|uniref:SCO4402 family protein n=1 Tax=Nocardia sp. IBHARD005 TaxID=3457765 RepID=UPI004059786B